MLAAALEAEVNAYLTELAEVNAYLTELAEVRDEAGHRRAVRNGYHRSRQVATSAGAVQVKVPGERQVPGLRGRAVRGDDQQADGDLDRGPQGVLQARPVRAGLRLRVGRRRPPEDPPGGGEGLRAGPGGRPGRREQGTDSPG